MRIVRALLYVLCIVIAIPVSCFLLGRVYQALKGNKKQYKRKCIDVKCIKV